MSSIKCADAFKCLQELRKQRDAAWLLLGEARVLLLALGKNQEVCDKIAEWISDCKKYDEQEGKAIVEAADKVMNDLEETVKNWKPETGGCKPENP